MRNNERRLEEYIRLNEIDQGLYDMIVNTLDQCRHLERKVSSLEDDLDDANYKIERYEENLYWLGEDE